MFKCLECGHIFDECEVRKVSENVGEYWGCEAYETTFCCPCCQGVFEEAVKCTECGDAFLEDELNHGYCDECQETKKAEYNNPDKCFELGSWFKEEVHLNSFLASMFTESEIEEILLNEIKASGIDCEKFIEADEDFFFELIEKEF